MKKIVSLTLLLLSLNHYALEATYKVTFKGNFSSSTHNVKNFPRDPHFSPLIVASHGPQFSMFETGSLATTGVKNVAETGNPRVLLSELTEQQMQGFVKDFKRGGGASGEGSSTATVNVSLDSPLISAITMIAPSPDWIIGVNNYSMVQGSEFIQRRVIPLYAMDAGTDLGENFTSSDKPNRMRGLISLLKNISGLSIDKPFGFLTIEKM